MMFSSSLKCGVIHRSVWNATVRLVQSKYRNIASCSSSKTYCTNIKNSYSEVLGHKHSDHCDVKEITVPVPYGNLAAKAWGEETNTPVLALHGWLDNCGTFDKLMPFLCGKYHIVALDAPGHGLSSHMPPGCHYTDIGLIMDIKKVTNFLGWKKFHIIGHSLGGSLALMFSSIFPELVEKLIIIDIFKPSSRPVSYFPNETIDAINQHFRNEIKLSSQPPVYTLKAAAERLKEGMHHEVTLEGASILCKRGTRPDNSGKGFSFSRDIRCRTIEQFSRRSHEFIAQFMSSLCCELLMILANNTHPEYKSATPEVLDKFLDIYRASCKRFVLKRVDGNHFVHLNNPEKIAPLVAEFLNQT